MIVEAWLDAEFEGGRHQRRVNQIHEIESGAWDGGEWDVTA
jgi:ribose 5-phosphate isomerase B